MVCEDKELYVIVPWVHIYLKQTYRDQILLCVDNLQINKITYISPKSKFIFNC